MNSSKEIFVLHQIQIWQKAKKYPFPFDNFEDKKIKGGGVMTTLFWRKPLKIGLSEWQGAGWELGLANPEISGGGTGMRARSEAMANGCSGLIESLSRDSLCAAKSLIKTLAGSAFCYLALPPSLTLFQAAFPGDFNTPGL